MEIKEIEKCIKTFKDNQKEIFKSNLKQVTMYTDGCSKGNPGVGGLGVVLLYLDKNNNLIKKEVKQGYKFTTNNRMELMAFIVGLKELKISCDVSIYSDSKYIVNAFNENWIDVWFRENFRIGKKNEVKNIDLWLELITLISKHRYTLNWVKGHNGDEYNERCDALANESLNGDLLCDEFFEKNIESIGA